MSRLEPKGIALAAGVLLPLVVFLGLVLGPGLSEAPGDVGAGPDRSAAAMGPAEMEIRFVRQEDGVVRVTSADGDTALRLLPPGEGGFLRGVLRPLERERRRHDAALDAPYRLLRTEAGRLLLEDPASDLTVDLAAFGPTSVSLFNSLLTGGPAPPVPALFGTPTSMEDRP